MYVFVWGDESEQQPADYKWSCCRFAECRGQGSEAWPAWGSDLVNKAKPSPGQESQDCRWSNLFLSANGNPEPTHAWSIPKCLSLSWNHQMLVTPPTPKVSRVQRPECMIHQMLVTPPEMLVFADPTSPDAQIPPGPSPCAALLTRKVQVDAKVATTKPRCLCKRNIIGLRYQRVWISASGTQGGTISNIRLATRIWSEE